MYCAIGSMGEMLDCLLNQPIESGEGLLIFVAEKNKPDLETLIAKLNEKNVLFSGGVFPGVIEGDQRFETGMVACIVPMDGVPVVVKDVSRAPSASLCASINLKEKNGKQTAMVMIDGLSSGIDRFLAALFHCLGNTVNYIGGGCGTLSLQPEPCVFSNQGLFQDAAVVSFIPRACGMGVRHGWHKLMGPMLATHTEGNRIITLNWEDAYTAYRTVIHEDSGQDLTRGNFYHLAMQYPFGIMKEGCEIVVRDAILLGENNELICCGDIPENAVLSVLKGDRGSLIAAARQAAQDALISGAQNRIQNDWENGHHQVLIFDCISRTLYLGDDFAKELQTINDAFCRVDGMRGSVGATSFGEIALSCMGSLEFYNKTTVVGIVHE